MNTGDMASCVASSRHALEVATWSDVAAVSFVSTHLQNGQVDKSNPAEGGCGGDG